MSGMKSLMHNRYKKFTFRVTMPRIPGFQSVGRDLKLIGQGRQPVKRSDIRTRGTRTEGRNGKEDIPEAASGKRRKLKFI